MRESALAAMDAVVGGTSRAGEVKTLAELHVVENHLHDALFWRPWSKPEIQAASARRLDEALKSDRGMVLSACHLGPFFLSMELISSLGHAPYTAIGSWIFDTSGSGYWGRRVHRWWTGVRARDERLVRADGAFLVLQALLEQGEPVQVHFDVPGSRETHFLGKPTMLATGSARLAIKADALVLPIRARRDGCQVWIDVSEPLDPRYFDCAEDLHDALAAVHERWILELPAALEDPRRPGFWEQGATADAWIRPEPRFGSVSASL